MALTPSSSNVTGGSGAMTQLFDSQLGSDQATIDTGAAGIAQTANHLLVILQLRCTTAAATDTLRFRFNGDTAGNYYHENMFGTGAAAGAAESNPGGGFDMTIPGASAAAGWFAAFTVYIPNYATTVNRKTAHFQSGTQVSATFQAANSLTARTESGLWNSTVAVSQLTCVMPANNFLAGSRMTIYGLT